MIELKYSIFIALVEMEIPRICAGMRSDFYVRSVVCHATGLLSVFQWNSAPALSQDEIEHDMEVSQELRLQVLKTIDTEPRLLYYSSAAGGFEFIFFSSAGLVANEGYGTCYFP